jgi:pantoate--beta-alanine ligase
MARDLNFNIQIVGAPIFREPDGLAMSSRNTYLEPGQRPAALTLYQSLIHAKALFDEGATDAAGIIQTARERIESFPQTKIDYISICHRDTLEEMQTVDGHSLMALAVKVGKTRLIDNVLFQ